MNFSDKNAIDLAWNNDNTIRNVTKRYRPTETSDKYVELLEGLEIEKTSARWMLEEFEFTRIEKDRILKPLFPLLDVVKILSKDIKSRCKATESTDETHSAAIWLTKGRVVKRGAMPSFQIGEEDSKIQFFHFSQTKPFERENVSNYRIPRNSRGVVEVFRPEMQPIGTEHVRMNIDESLVEELNVVYAPALVNYEFTFDKFFPIFQGVVVHKEDSEEVENAVTAEDKTKEFEN